MKLLNIGTKLLVLLETMFSVSSIIKGASFYGMETQLKNFVCSWQNPPEYYLNILNQKGFNSIRLPWALPYAFENNFSVMDHFVQEAYKYNFTILFDLHRIDYDHQDATPHDHGTTTEKIIEGWLTILNRYKNFDNILGTNSYNEYQLTDYDYLLGFNIQVLNAIQKEFGKRFQYFITGTNWGGEIQNMNLEMMSYHDQIHYSLHKYVFSIDASKDYEKSWDTSFGPFAGKNTSSGIGKVLVGEWGFLNQDKWWAERFTKYLKKRGVRDTYFWTISNSDGTGGLWVDDCLTFETEKYNLIKSFWEDEKKHLRGYCF